MKKWLCFVLLLTAVMALSDCSPPVSGTEQTKTDAGEVSGDTVITGCKSNDDCKTGERCQADGTCVVEEKPQADKPVEVSPEKATESTKEPVVESVVESKPEFVSETGPEPTTPEDAGTIEKPILPEPGPEPSGPEPAPEPTPEVSNAPTVSSINPTSICGKGKVTVVAKGSGFVAQTQARLQTVPLPTTVKNCCELSFVIDLSNTPTGNYKIEICNPPNDCSQEIDIKVLHPSTCP